MTEMSCCNLILKHPLCCCGHETKDCSYRKVGQCTTIEEIHKGMEQYENIISNGIF